MYRNSDGSQGIPPTLPSSQGYLVCNEYTVIAIPGGGPAPATAACSPDPNRRLNINLCGLLGSRIALVLVSRSIIGIAFIGSANTANTIMESLLAEMLSERTASADTDPIEVYVYGGNFSWDAIDYTFYRTLHAVSQLPQNRRFPFPYSCFTYYDSSNRPYHQNAQPFQLTPWHHYLAEIAIVQNRFFSSAAFGVIAGAAMRAYDTTAGLIRPVLTGIAACVGSERILRARPGLGDVDEITLTINVSLNRATQQRTRIKGGLIETKRASRREMLDHLNDDRRARLLHFLERWVDTAITPYRVNLAELQGLAPAGRERQDVIDLDRFL